MKWVQAHNLKTISLTKTMYSEICRYEHRAFNDDMSEENEKKQHLSTLVYPSGLIVHFEKFYLFCEIHDRRHYDKIMLSVEQHF